MAVPFVVAVALLALAVLATRWALDETLTRHSPVDPASSMRVQIHAVRQSAAEHEVEELVEAVVEICQLEVGASAVEESLVVVGGGIDVYEVVFRPSMDSADQRQLRGCVEDLRIDHFRAYVEAMEHRGP